ncbi:hypothetical protein J437_LFUL011518 [Ladona fulva]|uniref:Large ribosomal subunit protein mL44 n=1 Tax=Ladona fulva TaxID=123851 RepID=A0A8K0KAQ4_LADFU|nr:hypothetical protein J437_LFUL011518 [Ladona fulva]
MALFMSRIIFVNGIQRNSQYISAQRSIKRWVAPTLRVLKKRKEKMGCQPVQRRSAFLEWNYNAELYAFGKRLNEEFKEDLLQRAFTHKSYVDIEISKQREVGIENSLLEMKDNDELITKGEKFMTSFIKGYLRLLLPHFPEEGISAVHEYLLSNENLAKVSLHIGTKDLILCAEYPPSELTLAHTLKALVGALDSSDAASSFVNDLVITQLAGKDLLELWSLENASAILTSILNKEGKAPPEPRLLYEAGPTTILASYAVGIYSDKEMIGCGFGESAAVAEDMAARDALRRLFHTPENMKPLPFIKRPKSKDVSARAEDSNPSVDEWTSNKLKNIVKC